MIPKVSSLGNLQAAGVRSVTRAQPSGRGENSNAGQRRRSFDVNRRSRSRPGSCVDLLSLDTDVLPSSTGAIAIPSRGASPPPSFQGPLLEPLIESPASFGANDALAHMAFLSASLEQSSKPESPEPVAVTSHALSPASTSSEADCLASLDIITEAVPAAKSAVVRISDGALGADAHPKEATAAAVVAATEEPVLKPRKSSKKRVGPAARPGPNELRIYRRIVQLEYVHELLTNVTHVQHMFRGVASAPSTTAASAAVAAARLLSRSLSRAATRVREIVRDPTVVHVSEDALFTLAEYGWAEVFTEDAEQAKLMGCVEADLHHLPSGRTTSWCRPAVDKAWTKVGDAEDLHFAAALAEVQAEDAKGSVGPPAAGAQPPVMGPAVAAAAAAARRGLFSLESLAQQLVAAGQAVTNGAALLQQWLDEQKACVRFSPAEQRAAAEPVQHPVVVGFQAPTLAVAAGV